MEESIVNAAFVHFSEAKAALIDLQSLRVYTITLLVRVTLTDNVLWKKDDGQIRAIVEVKKATRADLKDSLLMQEASEMVGWLKDSKPWIEFYNGQ
ncbi:hypothetical protein AnigIFM60653_002715 [Aspergillus niger]|nr:hypothetical protein AnigIFM60653_002715 [Aspergillus niger]